MSDDSNHRNELFFRTVDLVYRWFRQLTGATDGHYLSSIRGGRAPWRIVRYERIADPESLLYPPALSRYVRPKMFERHLELYCKKCKVIPLEDLLSRISENRPIDPKTVVITFDGGYIDNFSTALPLLRRFDLPATVFIAPAFIGTQEYFWKDRIFAALLSLHAGGRPLHTVPFLSNVFPELFRAEISSPDILILAVGQFINLLQLTPPEPRTVAITQVLAELEHVGGYAYERAFLSWGEVREMVKHRISFGTLGFTHRPITELSKEELAQDIMLSQRRCIEEHVSPLPVYALPEGLHDERSLQLLSDLGISFAAALELPRTEDEFLREQKSFLFSRIEISQDNAAHEYYLYGLLYDR